MNRILLYSFLLLCLSTTALAEHVQSDTGNLPPSLQKVAAYNEEQAVLSAQNISLLVAFFAGIISILSPCTLALLPAFFVYTFEGKKQITKMTFIFGLGFLLGFVLLGLLAAKVGDASITLFHDRLDTYVQIVGLLFIGLGILKLMGKGLPGMQLPKMGKTTPQVFLFGFLFTLGWSACTGPIIAAVLIMASLLHNYVQAALLFGFYGFGILVPLFLAGILYDKYEFWKSPWIQGKEWTFGEIRIHSTNLLAGLMLLLIGSFFLFYGGTEKINGYDLMGPVFLLLALVMVYAFLRKRVSSHGARWGILVLLTVLYIYLVHQGIYTAALGSQTLEYLRTNTTAANIFGGLSLLIILPILYKTLKRNYINAKEGSGSYGKEERKARQKGEKTSSKKGSRKKKSS